MADTTADATVSIDVVVDDEAEASGGRRRRMPIVVAAALVVVLACGGAAAYFTGLLDGLLGGEDVAHAEAGAAALTNAPATPIFVELPDLVVSLNTNERKSTFLRARVTLEVADAAAAAAVEQLEPRIVDYCQVYLRELRPDDLRGSAGTLRLREELRRRIAAAIAPGDVRDVLFVDLLVQ